MAEYIDRAALMSLIESEAHRWGDDYDWWQCLADIEDFPAADVQPVVRCQNCQYSRKPDRTNMEENLACDGVLICFAGFDYVYPSYNREIFVSEDSFCSAGELKLGDTE